MPVPRVPVVATIPWPRVSARLFTVWFGAENHLGVGDVGQEEFTLLTIVARFQAERPGRWVRLSPFAQLDDCLLRWWQIAELDRIANQVRAALALALVRTGEVIVRSCMRWDTLA